MASNYRSLSAAEPRSGGKIVRPRRASAARTPYDRPTPTVIDPAPENPSWLARFVLPPTRFIASGAGKILSSVFSPDYDSDSSSSSGGDSSSEDEFDDDNNDNGIPSERDGNLNMKDETSEMVEGIRKEAAPADNSETKRAIENLIMQETFSREESDKLIRIIKSRTVGSLVLEDAEDRRRSEILDDDIPDRYSTALLEAKKWLEEKRLESSSKPDRDLTINSAMFPHMQVTIDNEGSPVDVAKSYMQVRPPWASPSNNPTDFKSPSPRGVQLFREEIPYTTGGNFTSSSKLKKDYNATGSWNIQEEIRRLRSKATEEMLMTPSSAKINWSAPAVETKSILNLTEADKVEDNLEDKMDKSSSSKGALNSTGTTASPQLPVLESAQDLSQNGALSSDPANCVPMDLEATQVIKRTEEKASRSFDEEHIIDGSNHEEIVLTVHTEKTCKLVSETSTEVLMVASGSQGQDIPGEAHQESPLEPTQPNSTSTKVGDQESPLEPIQPNSTSTEVGDDATEKQQGKRLTRSRKPRGRGK